jgi:signal transduction histidine kinase
MGMKINKASHNKKVRKAGNGNVPFWNRFSTLLNLYNIGIFFVLLVVVSLFAFQSGRDTIEQHVKSRLVSNNLTKINQLNQWLRNNEETVESTAARPLVRKNVGIFIECMKSGGECASIKKDLEDNHLFSIINGDQDILSLSIIRASDGMIIATTEPSLVGKFRENEPFFFEGKTHTFTENTSYSLSEQEAVMHIGSPIFGLDGKVIAVLAAHVNLDEMSNFIQIRSGRSATEDTYLVNAFNYFITEPLFGEGYTLKNSIYTDGVLDCLQGNSNTAFYLDYRGTEVIGAYNWMPKQEMCILSEIDLVEAYAPIHALRTRLILIGLGLLAVSVLVAYLITRWIAEPIGQLSIGAQRIGSGDLTARVQIKAKNEFRTLADSFNTMASNLEDTLGKNQQLVDELEVLNQNLESRVEQRTAQLKTSQIATLNIMQDIKKEVLVRKQAQIELAQQAAKLEQSNKDLQQFAYVASHDLQEPLRMVASYLQLLTRRYADRLDGDALEFINFAVDGAERMKALINDLLDYSRIGTRGQAFEPTDLNQVFGKVRVNLNSLIEENSALVAHDELPVVLADQTQMIQLFQNLVANAIKFHDEKIPQVHISAVEKNGEWLFSVTDNGIGIDPQYFDRIFIIFQRLHSKREYQGTGIGLAVCKRIVDRHGGRIWVESNPGEGASFCFTLPVHDSLKELE